MVADAMRDEKKKFDLKDRSISASIYVETQIAHVNSRVTGGVLCGFVRSEVESMFEGGSWGSICGESTTV